MDAVILAGGSGRLLRPITETRHKCMMPVLNKLIIERVIDSLPKDIGKIYIVTDYLGDKIEAYFAKRKKEFPNVEVVIGERPFGTAGSIKILEEKLKETFVVLQSDVISSVDITSLVNYHKKNKALLTLSIYRVREPYNYGIVGINEEGRVLKYLEKPKPDQVFSTLINAGTYVLEPAIFEQIPLYGYADFSEDIFPRILRKGDPVYGLEFRGMWIDIGDFQKYLEANRLLLERSMIFEVAQKTAARIVPPVLLGKAKIGKAAIGPNVSVADGAQIGNGTKIYDSVLYEGVKIATNCLISNSVIGERVKIGANSVIIGAMIGDGATILPHRKIGEGARVWPKKTVKKDIEEETLVGAPEDFRL